MVSHALFILGTLLAFHHRVVNRDRRQFFAQQPTSFPYIRPYTRPYYVEQPPWKLAEIFSARVSHHSRHYRRAAREQLSPSHRNRRVYQQEES